MSKKYFAAYLNMAQLNVENTLYHIGHMMGIADMEGLVEKELKENKRSTSAAVQLRLLNDRAKTAIDKERLLRLFTTHFRFLVPVFATEKTKESGEMTSNDLPKVKNELTDFFETLGWLRNEYTHYNPEPRKRNHEKQIVAYLYKCMDSGANVIKERFTPTNDGIPYESLAEMHAVYKATEKIFQGEEMRKEGKKVPKINPKTRQQDTYPNGTPKMMTVYRDRDDYFYRLTDVDGTFSWMGILLFTCLFIEKKYISMLFDGVKPYFEGATKADKKAVLEVFSVYRMRMPEEKYDSTRPDYALGLDMMNELQRCPKELYDTFCDKDKELFHVDVKSDNPDAVMDYGVSVKDGKVMLKRNRDRFAQFALRYIDLQKVFNDIRFQVSVGSYRFRFYDKQLAGDEKGLTSVRVLQKELNGFGRINEIEQQRQKRYKDFLKHAVVVEEATDDTGARMELLPDTAVSTPYITDSKSRYVINNNRVGFLFNITDAQKRKMVVKDNCLYYLPGVKKEGNQWRDGKEVELYAPMAWLSVYELPGLIFYHELYTKHDGAGKGLPTPEEVLKSYVTQYYQLFSDISQGVKKPITAYAPLTLRDVPEKLVDYLNGKTVVPDFQGRARTVVKQMLEETNKRLEHFHDKREANVAKTNKLGKGNYVNILPGKLASELMEDILDFQPCNSDNSNKATGANYASMQAALALSAKNKNELKDMFTSARLIGTNSMDHPFLMNALNGCSVKGGENVNVFDFYKAYLTAKISYLTTVLQEAKFESLPFLHADRKKWQKRDEAYCRELAARYLDEEKSLELPRGLFLKPVRNILKKIGLDTTDDDSISCLIPYYFDKKEEDFCQEFYEPTPSAYKRTYKYFSVLDDFRLKNSREPLKDVFLTTDEMRQIIGKDAQTGKRKRKEQKETAYIDRKIKAELDAVNTRLNRFGKPSITRLRKTEEEAIRSQAKTKLRILYKEYDDSERAIRRYMVQDILVWMMAKDILLGSGKMNNAEIEKAKLADVLPASAESILEMEVPFEVTLRIPLHGKHNQEQYTDLTIRQETPIKLKRYGEFFRYNGDSRLASLVALLKKRLNTDDVSIVVDKEKLNDEFERYDLQRSEIFGMVHQLEASVFDKCPELLKKPAADADEATRGRYYFNDFPVRQNFNEMLHRAGVVDSRLLIEVRNAFSHNSYKLSADVDDANIPEIADTIIHLFELSAQKARRLMNNAQEL